MKNMERLVSPQAKSSCSPGRIRFSNFFIPHSFTDVSLRAKKSPPRVAAIIPSYRPKEEWTMRLVRDLLKWNRTLTIYVVDDCTPREYKTERAVFQKIKTLSPRVRMLKTPENKLKAGAINCALKAIFEEKERPEVIVTLDDDVVIEKKTIKNLVRGLLADERLGAACSQCRALNKNKNFLTRLQGLEYLGFNGMRLADDGFCYGPLVMHGMLTAFRTEVFLKSGNFRERHLIEDYEITARMKHYGFRVRMIPDSYAWTEVPETLPMLWEQRTRWIYGGLLVLSESRSATPVLQDIIGHGIFLSTFSLVICSLFLSDSGSHVPRLLSAAILAVSLLHLFLWYSFQVWYMRFYRERDKKDWLIRLALLPEFLYANALAVLLLGAYAFHIVNKLAEIPFANRPSLKKHFLKIQNAFAHLGYTKSWGTR